MMAMKDTEKIIVVFLSLALSITAYTDFQYRPTPRPHARPHTREASSGNRYTATVNATTIHTHMGTRSTDTQQNKPRQHGDDTPLVYPDHASCMYGLCTKVPNYPKEQIEKLLTSSELMHGYFQASEESIVIDNRFNSDEMTLCETKAHTIYPESANNTMMIEKVIVNVEGHKQGIVFETCVDNGKCKFSSNFPTGYTSYCKQKYIHKRLMVLGDNDKFVFDSFEVPSCCVCTVTRTD